jgi:hypothetical protein
MDEAWDTRDEMKSKIIKRDAVDAAGNERKEQKWDESDWYQENCIK